jgi:hypothetical protein
MVILVTFGVALVLALGIFATAALYLGVFGAFGAIRHRPMQSLRSLGVDIGCAALAVVSDLSPRKAPAPVRGTSPGPEVEPSWISRPARFAHPLTMRSRSTAA